MIDRREILEAVYRVLPLPAGSCRPRELSCLMENFHPRNPELHNCPTANMKLLLMHNALVVGNDGR